MTFTGRFRVYYNRHQAAPLVWCVATDAWELAVAGVVIEAPARTAFKLKAIPDHDDGKPSAWLDVGGVLTVTGSIARIVDYPMETFT